MVVARRLSFSLEKTTNSVVHWPISAVAEGGAAVVLLMQIGGVANAM